MTEYEQGFTDGWARAHEPAKCGHARGNWKDPRWPESERNCFCYVCEQQAGLLTAARVVVEHAHLPSERLTDNLAEVLVERFRINALEDAMRRMT